MKKTNPYPRTNRRDPVTHERKITFKHRDMAEFAMGRCLRPGEVVHHENNDKDDFHPSNLKVFSGQAAHTLYHHYLKREAEGVGHLFTLEEWLEHHGERVVWAGDEAG